MAIANITNNILTDSGVTTSSLLPLSGGTLTGNLGIQKTSGIATLNFPITGSQNDPAFIQHEETTVDTSIMRFSVSDNNLINDYFVFGNTGGGAGAFLERFIIKSTGNLGVAVNPNDWNSSFNAIQLGSYGGFIAGRTNENSMFLGTNHYFDSTTSQWIYTTTGAVSQMFFNGADIVFRNNVSGTAGTATGFSERLRITSGGNVGIGTSSPSSFSGYNNLSLQASTSGYNLDFFNNSGVRRACIIYNTAVNFTLSAIESIPMNFETAGIERMRITSGGNVVIGTASTGRRLNVGSTTTAGFFHNTSNATSSYCNIWQLGGSETNNTSSYYLLCDTDSVGVRMVIYGNGNLANANGSYGAYSDIKLKENITDATPKLNDLLKVKVRNYNLKGDNTKQIGVIAQELEEIFPALIEESNDTIKNEDGENIKTGEKTKSVKYSVFVPMLIKAIQEQQAQIEELKSLILNK